MEKIFIKCNNCGFTATSYEDDELLDTDEIEDDEQESCPKCLVPMVEVEDEEEIQKIKETINNKEKRVLKFEIEED